MTNGAQPVAPQPAPKKKGLSPLAWIAIGCGGLILIMGILFVAGVGFFAHKAKTWVQEAEKNPGLATAKLIVAANPDLDMVAVDEDAGTMTIRNTKTGEEVTLSFEDIKEGKITFETEEGKVSMQAQGGEEGGSLTITGEEGSAVFGTGAAAGELPDWIPAYPGATTENVSTMTVGAERGGTYLLKTSDSPQEVMDFFKSALEGAGFTVETVSMSVGGGPSGMVSGRSADDKRSYSVTLSVESGVTQGFVMYGEKP